LSISGAIEVNVRPPPSHFSNKTFVSATEVIEEVSSATVRIFSTGTRLTSRIERTAGAKRWRRRAAHQSGNLRVGGGRNDSDVGGPGL
jgi:hypothetical protein